jgi:2',3'-cyclic-nucleotide 2'-phosphodiesterase (5'-nucleotidase family)
MGNLVSDAFRWKMNAAIGLVNGGGLRNSIKAGAVNYGHIISVQPFDNLVCLIEATGQQIIDMLAKCAAKCPEADGSFPQVSGMRYTIHTATHTVSDITVFDKQTNAYLPLDPQRTYTIATTDYYNNGGYYYTLQDCRLIENTQLLARDVITEYLEKQLKGNIDDSYHTTQGRITIVDD